MKHLLIVLLIVLAGCGRSPELDVPKVIEKETEEVTKVTNIEEAEKLVREYEIKLGAAQKNLEAMEAAQKRAYIRNLQWIAYIIAASAFLAGLACVAASFFLPAGKKMLFTGALAAFSIMALSLLFTQIIPYLIWVGIAVGVVIVGAIIWSLWKNKEVHKETLEVGTTALHHLKQKLPEIAYPLLRDALDRQSDKGIHTLIDQITDPLKTKLKEAEKEAA